jgi:hypothetical protein
MNLVNLSVVLTAKLHQQWSLKRCRQDQIEEWSWEDAAPVAVGPDGKRTAKQQAATATGPIAGNPLPLVSPIFSPIVYACRKTMAM